MIKVFPLDFFPPNQALIQPKDQHLHDLAVEFCLREVNTEINLSNYEKVYVAAEVDETQKPVKVEGVSGYVWRPDICLYRAISARATAKLHYRWHTYFADKGILGQQVLIHLDGKETPEQRCANWNNELMAAKAVPADRFLVEVRAM